MKTIFITSISEDFRKRCVRLI